ncbi:hypothetical protein EC968_009844 [Mortierella alpina]|nr:hypothetical protein EC968_009844 [Mortierella alpina]
MSTSSLGTLAKSPSSLTASLSASVALYDSHQPPRTLQDILLLAQSHYISHRYVPALTLYRLAAEKHHSLPACCSLYALYTSTVKTPGLVRSDTKATEVLIHALRIWSARRWSSSFSSLDGGHPSSMRSKTRDDHAELEEYFAHPRSASTSQPKSGRSLAKNNNKTGGASIPISSRRDPASKPIVAESIESEYRSRELRNPLDGSESEDSVSGSESESESGSESGTDDEDSEEDDDCDSECEECQNCDGGCEHCEECEEEEEEEEDEEQAKEEEARRIGLATLEIEDIIQKLCSMIQKGVLGLDEAIVVEAISMVRKIERGLSKDGEAWQTQMAKSKSLFESSLSGGKTEGEGVSSSLSGPAAGLLLTQSIDLSFLNLTPESTSPMSQVRAVDLSSRKRAKADATTATSSKSYPVNTAISRLSIGEQEADQAICRAMRIRILFTLGWVHQQRGEYHWGAQAYGVCSEVTPPTGKRLLISLQQQATVQKWTCLAFEKKAQEQQAQAEEERQRALVEQQQQKPERIPSPPASTQQQQQPQQRRQPRKLTASPSYTSSDVSTATHHHADISSPSSYSSSESAAISIRGGQAGTTISSLSAAMWSSGLFKSSTTTPSETSIPTTPASTTVAAKPTSPAGTLSSVQSDPTSKSSTSRQLHRSKSVSLGLKINTLNSREAPQETKEKEPQHHQHHHHPRAQHRAKGHHPHAQGSSAAAVAAAAAALTMTMSDHQKKVVKCGHCGQKRILMPLCVCKKVRYCNRECRIADLEAHRKTGCHAALMSTSGGSTSSSGGGSTATATAAAAAELAMGPGVSM